MIVARRPRVDDANGGARAGADRPPTRARDARLAPAVARAVALTTQTRAHAVVPTIRSIESSAFDAWDASNCRVGPETVSRRCRRASARARRRRRGRCQRMHVGDRLRVARRETSRARRRRRDEEKEREKGTVVTRDAPRISNRRR